VQDNPMQTVIQPFVKLVQGNMELIAKFSTSPEAASQAGSNLQGLFQQNQESATRLFQSNAFAQLMQGMLKNYTEFMTELGQTGMAVATQAQEAMVRQTQQATDNVVDVSSGPRSRRG
jgi:hypothetical protein